MKKAASFPGKKAAARKGRQNKVLPGQLNKQLKKHYLNKYGVVKKERI